jgi:hypothetical protein
MLTYSLSNGVIATLRTSGTEPKLKFYAEGCGFDREWVKAELRRTVGLIIDEMIEPERYNLKRPIFWVNTSPKRQRLCSKIGKNAFIWP